MKQKRYILLSLIALLLIWLGLWFFGTKSQNKDERKNPLVSNEHDLPAILKRGKLTILAENASTSFFIYKGKKMGFEYEILKEFGEDLGVPLDVKIVSDLDRMNDQLNSGEGDVLACNYTVTRDRQDLISFSTPYFQSNQVLVQRKSEKTNETLIHDPLQLARKKVCVWPGSSYYQRLLNLQNEIGDTIFIKPTQGYQGVEELIELVADGQIDYTIAEKNVALINERYYDNIDANLAVSFKQNIAFGLPKDAPLLKKRLDKWLKKFMQKETFSFIKRKYFEQINQLNNFQNESYSSKRGAVSPYDAIMRAEAARYGLDWRFVAAIIYHESGFNPNARAFGGAYGLMQFMPGTGPNYGVYPSSSPQVQIQGGMKFISKLDKIYKNISDPKERLKFVLATYNAGTGHIQDARRLAEKKGLNPNVWDNNVESIVLNLGKRQYYADASVKSGTFRGRITYRYVKNILERYELYKTLAK